jgi:hypothetical protein
MRSKPWYLKWFIFLILIRPLIDSFYFLKDISPFISPLNWAGVLTPLLSIPAITRYRHNNNRVHQLFNIWSILIIINTLFVLFKAIDLLSMSQWVLKLSLPVYLFAFLRIFIRNKFDLTGILTTFLYACLIAAVMMLYEILFKPLQIEYSRGIERISGGYADVMNYAIYLNFGFLIVAYFYFTYKNTRNGLKIGFPFLLMIGFFCIVGLVRISHVVSYAVFSSLILIFVISIARKYTLISLFLVGIFWAMISLFGNAFYQEKIDPLVDKEFQVINGERKESQLFHGRMYRWQYAWANFKESPIMAWVIGYSYSTSDPFFNIGIGIHDDYLRIFYFTGLLGLFLYLLFLFTLWKRRRYLFHNDRFLLSGALAMLILYSVSTTPSFYPNFLYVLFSIFAFVSLPPSILSGYYEIKSADLG